MIVLSTHEDAHGTPADCFSPGTPSERLARESQHERLIGWLPAPSFLTVHILEIDPRSGFLNVGVWADLPTPLNS